MVKIRTVIPPNAKPGTSVIQVVNPRTNKPTRIRVPANAQPGQVIELELPEDVNKSLITPSNKLGSVPPPRSLNPEPVSEPSRNSPSFSKPTHISPKQIESSHDQVPASSSFVKVPTQFSLDKRGNESTAEREPLVPQNTSENKSTDTKTNPGCCYSCITLRFCGSLCG